MGKVFNIPRKKDYLAAIGSEGQILDIFKNSPLHQARPHFKNAETEEILKDFVVNASHTFQPYGGMAINQKILFRYYKMINIQSICQDLWEWAVKKHYFPTGANAPSNTILEVEQKHLSVKHSPCTVTLGPEFIKNLPNHQTEWVLNVFLMDDNGTKSTVSITIPTRNNPHDVTSIVDAINSSDPPEIAATLAGWHDKQIVLGVTDFCPKTVVDKQSNMSSSFFIMLIYKKKSG